jgi:hypothetical protein
MNTRAELLCGDNPAKMIPQDSITALPIMATRGQKLNRLESLCSNRELPGGVLNSLGATPGDRMGLTQRFSGFFVLGIFRGHGATEIPKSRRGGRTAWGSRAQNFCRARGLISAFDFREIK